MNDDFFEGGRPSTRDVSFPATVTPCFARRTRATWRSASLRSSTCPTTSSFTSFPPSTRWCPVSSLSTARRRTRTFFSSHNIFSWCIIFSHNWRLRYKLWFKLTFIRINKIPGTRTLTPTPAFFSGNTASQSASTTRCSSVSRVRTVPSPSSSGIGPSASLSSARRASLRSGSWSSLRTTKLCATNVPSYMLRHCDFVHVDLKKQKRTKVYISLIPCTRGH